MAVKRQTYYIFFCVVIYPHAIKHDQYLKKKQNCTDVDWVLEAIRTSLTYEVGPELINMLLICCSKMPECTVCLCVCNAMQNFKRITHIYSICTILL